MRCYHPSLIVHSWGSPDYIGSRNWRPFLVRECGLNNRLPFSSNVDATFVERAPFPVACRSSR